MSAKYSRVSDFHEVMNANKWRGCWAGLGWTRTLESFFPDGDPEPLSAENCTNRIRTLKFLHG